MTPTEAPVPLASAPEFVNLQAVTPMDVVNVVLVVLVCAFIYRLLLEMLFRDRGKYCPSCGLRDLPRNWSACQGCGMVLMEYLEQVGRRPRLVAFWTPAALLLAALIAYNRVQYVEYGGQMVVLVYVVGNALFAQGWLPGRDTRLRTMFNVPFWGAVGLAMLLVLGDSLLRVESSMSAAPGAAAVEEMEIGTEGTPILALREGALSHGVGPTAYAYLRGLPVRRLLASGSGDVFVYIASGQLAEPDALIGPTGVIWNPPKERVELGLKLKIGGADLPPDVRAQLNRAAYQSRIDFCYAWERLWFLDGKSLYRVDTAGRVETFVLNSEKLGTLLRVSPGNDMIWLLSANGLTGIARGSDRKVYYPLVDYEFAVREGQNKETDAQKRERERLKRERAVTIQAGAIQGEFVWFSTSNGDVFSFDTRREHLSYEGGARCPRYLDYYGLYTMPFLFFALFWTLAANFREEVDKK